MEEVQDPYELLKWFVSVGVDEVIDNIPRNRYGVSEDDEPLTNILTGISKNPPVTTSVDELKVQQQVNSSARAIAGDCNSLPELANALSRFDGCALKGTATNLVFGDGDPNSGFMLIGEAPGAEEDRQGLPFVGTSGQLLDLMLDAIGYNRSSCYITNILCWRPPGNRKPTPAETEACLPFVERHIELVNPKVLILIGGTSANVLLRRTEGITKLRGQWFNYSSQSNSTIAEIPSMAIYHPAYLLRQPALKREVWKDLLNIKERINSLV